MIRLICKWGNMPFKYIFLTFILFLLTFGEKVIVQIHSDKIFDCHVIMQLWLPSWSVCLEHCTKFSVCKSMNFIKGINICEINTSTPDGVNTFLTDSPGNVFIDVSSESQKLAGTCSYHDCGIEEICKTGSTEFTCQPSPFNPERCKIGWDYYQGHCYYFGLDSFGWLQAQTDCSQMCSNLVKIEDILEEQWLKSVIIEREYDRSFWIGATDQYMEGDWIWVSDGLSLTYTNWHTYQPDNGWNDEDCVELSWLNGYYWNDVICTGPRSYICEKLYYN